MEAHPLEIACAIALHTHTRSTTRREVLGLHLSTQEWSLALASRQSTGGCTEIPPMQIWKRWLCAGWRAQMRNAA